MTLVTIVERTGSTRQRTARILQTEGFDVVEVDDGPSALRSLFDERPDAALVDLATQGLSGGTELIRILRSACDLSIIGLVDEDDSAEIVRALDAGADDVILKSCGPVELLARIRAAVRRYQRADRGDVVARRIETGAIEIDRDARIVRKDGEIVPLTNTEYRLLEALATRIGQTAPHRYLLTNVWGEEYLNDVQYLRVYVGYLRQKLEDDPRHPQYFLSEWGVGYRLARLPLVSSNVPSLPMQELALVH